jgi:hypothetical protein
VFEMVQAGGYFVVWHGSHFRDQFEIGACGLNEIV